MLNTILKFSASFALILQISPAMWSLVLCGGDFSPETSTQTVLDPALLPLSHGIGFIWGSQHGDTSASKQHRDTTAHREVRLNLRVIDVFLSKLKVKFSFESILTYHTGNVPFLSFAVIITVSFIELTLTSIITGWYTQF